MGITDYTSTTVGISKPWYYFGKCTPYPVQLRFGTLPVRPYKKFNTKEECQAYIDAMPKNPVKYPKKPKGK